MMTQPPEDTKKLTLNLPTDMHKALKLMAVEAETSMTALVLQWIEERLKKGKR